MRHRLVDRMNVAASDAIRLYQSRAEVYDVDFPIWKKMAFGDVSFAQHVFGVACRIVSLIRTLQVSVQNKPLNMLDDCIQDIITYALVWKAWRLGREIGDYNETDDDCANEPS